MSAVPSEVARRYAKALFELASESGSLDKIVNEVVHVAEAYSGHQELALALDNPLIALGAKRAILGELSDKLRVSPLVKNTVLLLGDRRRTKALPAIAQALIEFADRKKGLVRAEVTSAVALPDAFYDKLKLQLERVTGKKITVDRRIDPNIVGGVIARIGDRIFDGSLQSRLAEVRQHLLPN